MAKVITQRTVESARPPREGREAKADGLVSGMQFVIHAGGKKSFRLRSRVHGQLVNFDIGDASLMTLADARAKAKGILGVIANGGDPREAKQEAVRAAAETVEIVVRRFIERYAKVHNKSWQEIERKLTANVLPSWGKRPLASITKRDVIALLDSIVDRGAVVEVNRVLAAVRKFFGWCVERDLIEASPCMGIKPPTPETARDRVLTDAELSLIWRAADTLGYPFGPFIQLLALTGQRRSEVAGMPWSELDEGLVVWSLPPTRTKNGLPHQVPIVAGMRSILADLPRIAESDFVLTTNGTSPISGFAKAKIAVDAAIAMLNGAPLAPWTFHDLRRGMVTRMGDIGIFPHVVESAINHVSGVKSGVAGTYNRALYWPERIAAYERWAAHIAGIVSGEGTANVIALRR